MPTETGIPLTWGKHLRDGQEHEELHAPCGCAFHPFSGPHERFREMKPYEILKAIEVEAHWHPCATHEPLLDPLRLAPDVIAMIRARMGITPEEWLRLLTAPSHGKC